MIARIEFDGIADHHDRNLANYIHDVLGEAFPKASIDDVYHSYERVDWWALEAVADTYAVVTSLFMLSKAQQVELVEMLWEERATVPGDPLEFNLVELAEHPEVINVTRLTYSALMLKGFMVER